MSQALLTGLGLAIREARKAKGETQESLSLRTGVHRNYIGGVERGERSPTVATIATLAAALDTPVYVLLERAESGSSPGR